MHDPEPTPRPDLFTNKDEEAWLEQFLLLRYTLRMSPERIAQIDYGLDPEHPYAWAAGAFWAGRSRAATLGWRFARSGKSPQARPIRPVDARQAKAYAARRGALLPDCGPR